MNTDIRRIETRVAATRAALTLALRDLGETVPTGLPLGVLRLRVNAAIKRIVGKEER